MKILQYYWYRCASKYEEHEVFNFSVSYTDAQNNSETKLEKSEVNNLIGSRVYGFNHSYGEEK